METIATEFYTTSNPDKRALIFKAFSVEMPNKKKHLLAYLDHSGSMLDTMDNVPQGSSYDPMQTPGIFQSGPAPPPPMLRAVATQGMYDPYATPSVSFPAPPGQVDDDDDAPPPISQLRAVGTQSFYDPSGTPAVSFSGPSLPGLGSHSIEPNSRLGVVLAFTEKMLDFLLANNMAGVTELTIIPFDSHFKVFSTLDGLDFNQIRLEVRNAFLKNGGTNFNCLKTAEEYKKKYSEKMIALGETDYESSVLLVSDGETDDKATILQKYGKYCDMCIGIGECGLDRKTLIAISKEAYFTTSAHKIRDFVTEWFFGVVTNLGEKLTFEANDEASHVYCTNMNMVVDKDGNRKYVWPRMSLLMQLYADVSPGTYKLSYILQDGTTITTVINTDTVTSDTSFGDKISFTLQILEKLENMKKESDDMSPQCKMDYIKSIKEFIDQSEHLETFKDTILGIYCRQLQAQVNTISLSPGDKRFLELVGNVKTDAYRSASSIAADTFSPSPSATPAATPLLAVSSSTSSSNNVCLLAACSDSARTIIYQPCGHFRTCTDCSLEWDKQQPAHCKKCPYCTQAYTGWIVVKLSAEQNKDSWNMKCGCKRKLEVYSKKCGHIFSCKKCIAGQEKTGKVCCTICGVESTGSDLLDKIFM